MAILIKSAESQKTYLLIGSGYGMYESKKPHWFLGDILSDTARGSTKLICACDENGTIVWLKSNSIKVVSIDGKSPSSYLD